MSSPLNAENLTDLRVESLPLHRFSPRATGILFRLRITTLGEFLDCNWETQECWQLGEGARQELREIQDEIRANPRAWLGGLAQIIKDWDEALLGARLPLEELSTRARNALLQNEITTLGAFLTFEWQGVFIRQIGAKTRAEFEAWKDAIGTTQESARAWVAANCPALIEKNVSAEVNSADEGFAPNAFHLPQDLTSEEIEAPDFLALWPRVVREVLESNPRNLEVLKRRFGLDGSQSYTLDELRLVMNVSRERVRQIEKTALESLKKTLAGYALRGSKKALHPAVLQAYLQFGERLEAAPFPLRDAELWALLSECDLEENERAFALLFLNLEGLATVTPAPPELPIRLERLWLRDATDRDFVVTVLSSLARQLRECVEPVPLFDLLIEVNRALEHHQIGRGCDEETLRQLLLFWPQAEEVAADFYQTRFEFLPTQPLRVERVMRDWASQGVVKANLSEIAREINARYARVGVNAQVSTQMVSMACSLSPHLDNIGKSGYWTLKTSSVETRDVHELIHEALLLWNRPATLTELSAYVGERRECGTYTVACLIQQHEEFVRVGHGVYALRAWGVEEASPRQRRQRDFVEEHLLEIFLENEVEPIPFADLAKRLQERIGGHINTARLWVRRSPHIEIKQMSAFRLMAHWRDEPLSPEKLPQRLTKTRQVHTVARELLEKSPNAEMTGARLSRLIAERLRFNRALIYTALADCPQIERRGQPGSMIFRWKEASKPIGEKV